MKWDQSGQVGHVISTPLHIKYCQVFNKVLIFFSALRIFYILIDNKIIDSICLSEPVNEILVILYVSS